MISEQQTPIKSGFHSKTNADEITNGIDLNDKIANVTGGYSGIGLETTRELVATGAKVINIDPKKMQLIINYENENIIFKIQDN